MGSYKKNGLSHEMGLIDTPPFRKKNHIYYQYIIFNYPTKIIYQAQVVHVSES